MISLFVALMMAFGFSICPVGATTGVNQKFCEAKLDRNHMTELASLIPYRFNNTNLNFSKSMGKTENHFFRQNNVAAHIMANYGAKSSVVVGFADNGNSGVSMFFEESAHLKMKIHDSVSLAPTQNGLHGIVTEIEADGVETLIAKDFALGNIRRIRDREDAGKKMDAVDEQIEWDGARQMVRVTRTISPEHRYEMHLQAGEGSRFAIVNGKVILTKNPGHTGPLRFRVTALTSETLLNALPIEQIIRPEFLHTLDPQTLNMLAFVVYKEKWLAGSWRYLTYFGRDSMMSTMLILKALQPQAVEAALAGVLDRVDDVGRVSHEETLADYAYFLSRYTSFSPRQDYEMVDSNLMPPILMQEYFTMVSERDANAFLDRRAANGKSYRDVFDHNMQFIVSSAYDFAHHMSEARKNNDQVALENGYQKLIHLLDGRFTGQWRDSEWGLGLGKIAFDVNVAYMPAALAAAYDIYSSSKYGLFQELSAKRAQSYYFTWKNEAPTFFKVQVSQQDLKNAESYVHSLGLKMPNQEIDRPITYYAVSLNEDGTPVKVMNSDEGSYLMFGLPTDEELMFMADRVLLQFPYGLKSPIGLLIANAAFAPAEIQKYFTADHYHGTLAWGREHAVMLFGLMRQLERTDLKEVTQAKLQMALSALWDLMEETAAFQEAELWTWRADEHGNMVYLAYGSKPSHHTAANPIQTWSLAVAILRESARERVANLVGISQARLHKANGN